MNRLTLFAVLAVFSIASAGCATKKYVRNQTQPVVDKVNELDTLTAKNSRDIKDVDARAQQGIQQVNTKAAEADQKAMQAGQAADQANQSATQASNRVTSLSNTIANLDNYRPVVDTVVHFAFNKYNLTPKAKEALDQLGTQIGNTPHYILVVDGNTDATGSADYNYQLSQRRADTVIQYLAAKYNVPAFKIYLIGLGKDKPAAPNSTSKGRAENRRVQVSLMTNREEAPSSAQSQQQ
jgi:OmpA-OmpF porin, OOP family